MEAKVSQISKTNQEQSNDLTNIQTEMNGMLSEALHSAALATTFSGSNGSTIGDSFYFHFYFLFFPLFLSFSFRFLGSTERGGL